MYHIYLFILPFLTPFISHSKLRNVRASTAQIAIIKYNTIFV